MLPNPIRTLLCIGYGNMGAALVDRWAEQSDAEIYVADSDPARLGLARQKQYIPLGAVAELPSSLAIDAVLLGVKPQQFPSLRSELVRGILQPRIVISILTGTSTEALAAAFPPDVAIIRAMPNLPARIGLGVTACFTEDGAARRTAEDFFSVVGDIVWLDSEDSFDAVTAVSGAGPAYLFYFIECLRAAGERLGLSAEVAHRLALRTVFGAAGLAIQSSDDPASLRAAVTSKAGTTAAALEVLMASDGGLLQLIERAVEAASRRARELAQISVARAADEMGASESRRRR